MPETRSWRLFAAVWLCCTLCSQHAVASERLQALFEREWAFRMAEFPLLATEVGDHRYDEQIGSVAVGAQRRRVEYWRGALAELRGIETGSLAKEDRVNYRIFERQLEDFIATYQFSSYEIPMTAETGFHTDFARLPSQTRFAGLSDYERYLTRLQAFPVYVEEQIENMRRGLARGMSLPRVVLQGYEVTIATHIVDDPTDSLFYRPFDRLPTGLTEAEAAQLRLRARSAISRALVPAYQRLLYFMLDEYLPGARNSIAASELPNGAEYYAQRVRFFTTPI